MSDPLWTSEDNVNPGVVASATYIGETHEYEVVVTYKNDKKIEKVPALYVPIFGIDKDDAAVIYEVAGRLSDALVEEHDRT